MAGLGKAERGRLSRFNREAPRRREVGESGGAPQSGEPVVMCIDHIGSLSVRRAQAQDILRAFTHRVVTGPVLKVLI